MNEDNSSQQSYHRSSLRAEISEIVVLFGIVAEVVLEIRAGHSAEAISNGFVALGILGTFHWGRKAREAGDVMLADAESRIEIERTKRLELEARIWRNFDPEQQQAFIEALRPFRTTKVAVVSRPDPESMALARQISGLLRSAEIFSPDLTHISWSFGHPHKTGIRLAGPKRELISMLGAQLRNSLTNVGSDTVDRTIRGVFSDPVPAIDGFDAVIQVFANPVFSP